MGVEGVFSGGSGVVDGVRVVLGEMNRWAVGLNSGGIVVGAMGCGEWGGDGIVILILETIELNNDIVYY